MITGFYYHLLSGCTVVTQQSRMKYTTPIPQPLKFIKAAASTYIMGQQFSDPHLPCQSSRTEINFQLHPTASRYSSCLGYEKASFQRDVFYESETMTYEQLCKISHDETNVWLSSSFLESLVNVIQCWDKEGEAIFKLSPSCNS